MTPEEVDAVLAILKNYLRPDELEKVEKKLSQMSDRGDLVEKTARVVTGIIVERYMKDIPADLQKDLRDVVKAFVEVTIRTIIVPRLTKALYGVRKVGT